jgi:hypothetical protein
MNCHHADEPDSVKFGLGMKTGIVTEMELAEVSGLVNSRANPGMYWAINDSGNFPKLYLIDREGKLVHSYWIDGATNFDWEDIAIYTDQETEKSRIYIADIGDNYAIRDFVKIISFDEPVAEPTSDTVIYNASTSFYRYEDGARDAETLLIDPLTAEIFVISKREENVRIYEVEVDDVKADDTLKLSYISSLPFRNINAGDITSDGSEILLKNYTAIFYWNRSGNEKITDALARPHERLQYYPEPQGESITWELGGKGFYTLSERNEPKEQVMYYYRRE